MGVFYRCVATQEGSFPARGSEEISYLVWLLVTSLLSWSAGKVLLATSDFPVELVSGVEKRGCSRQT